MVKFRLLRLMVPHLTGKVVNGLERHGQVDFLIGMKHPSWYLERAEKAKGGGDLWLFCGRFGLCIGGRHHEVKEGTCRSDSLFSVNHVYSSQVLCCPSEDKVVSHELEFCLGRIEKYVGKSNFHVKAGLVKPTVPGPRQSTCIASGKSVNPGSVEWREAASAVAVSDGVGFVDGFSVEDDRLLVESSVTVGAGGVPIEVTEVPVPTSPVEGDSVEEVTSVDDVPVGDDGVQVKEVPSIRIQDDISDTACVSTKTSVLFCLMRTFSFSRNRLEL